MCPGTQGLGRKITGVVARVKKLDVFNYSSMGMVQLWEPGKPLGRIEPSCREGRKMVNQRYSNESPRNCIGTRTV